MSRGEVGNKMAGTLDLLLLPCGREDGGGGRLFECKTCSRRFPTFQALGGHRTSHSRPRCNLQRQMLKLKPRLHACPVCGLAFPMGQALGGHMRRHKMEAVAAADDHKDGGASASGTSAAGKLQWLDLNLPPLENELQLRSVGSSSSSPSTSQELTNNFSACSSYSA